MTLRFEVVVAQVAGSRAQSQCVGRVHEMDPQQFGSISWQVSVIAG